jgi:hypothetical protein
VCAREEEGCVACLFSLLTRDFSRTPINAAFCDGVLLTLSKENFEFPTLHFSTQQQHHVRRETVRSLGENIKIRVEMASRRRSSSSSVVKHLDFFFLVVIINFC